MSRSGGPPAALAGSASALLSAPASAAASKQNSYADLKALEARVSIPLRIVVLGGRNVGKSALITRYTKNYFAEKPSATAGFDVVAHTLPAFKLKPPRRSGALSEVDVDLRFVDVAHAELFGPNRDSVLSDADAVVFVADVSDVQGSVPAVDAWRAVVAGYAPSRHLPLALFVNKRDLFPATAAGGGPLPLAVLEKFCKGAGIRAQFGTSARSHSMTKAAFDTFIHLALQSYFDKLKLKPNATVNALAGAAAAFAGAGGDDDDGLPPLPLGGGLQHQVLRGGAVESVASGAFSSPLGAAPDLVIDPRAFPNPKHLSLEAQALHLESLIRSARSLQAMAAASDWLRGAFPAPTAAAPSGSVGSAASSPAKDAAKYTAVAADATAAATAAAADVTAGLSPEQRTAYVSNAKSAAVARALIGDCERERAALLARVTAIASSVAPAASPAPPAPRVLVSPPTSAHGPGAAAPLTALTAAALSPMASTVASAAAVADVTSPSAVSSPPPAAHSSSGGSSAARQLFEVYCAFESADMVWWSRYEHVHTFMTLARSAPGPALSHS